MNLYTRQIIGNINFDFIRIVAKLVKIPINITFVEEGCDVEQKLLEATKEIDGTFPILEY
jgi:hypothetical protein